MRKKVFLEKFYNDKVEQTVLQCAVAKAIKIKDEEKFRFYSRWLNDLEARMTDYINKHAKLVSRIDFVKEGYKYRIGVEEQKIFTKNLLEKEMTIEELQEWVEGPEW